MTTRSTPLLGPLFLFRFLNTGFHDGFYNMGLDEALLEGVLGEGPLEGRKISGNAQTRRIGCVLQHGTLLLANEVDLIFEVLLVHQEKLTDKGIQAVRDRVTSLKALLGRYIAYEEVASAMAKGFHRGLSLEFKLVPLGMEEEERARELATGKFAAPEWLYSR
jgi:lipoate-protein ligase A